MCTMSTRKRPKEQRQVHQLQSSDVQGTLQERMRKVLDAVRSCQMPLAVRLYSIM